MEPLAILLGGALGGVARFWLADFTGRRWGRSFPRGTLLVNVTGALVAGAAAALAGPGGAASIAWQLGITGFLGSYTTVSSFSLETLALLHDGATRRAAANVAATLLATLGGVILGWTLALRLLEALA
jgi:CrcB protein